MNPPAKSFAQEVSRGVPAAPPAVERRTLAAIPVSLVLLAGIWLMPTPAGLPEPGQRALAVTLFAVVWWVAGVMAPAYTALLLCLGYIVLGLVAAGRPDRVVGAGSGLAAALPDQATCRIETGQTRFGR